MLKQSVLLLAASLAVCMSARAQEKQIFDREIDFHAMTSAEQTAARREARRRKYDQLTFCADPGNMPLSNARGEGIQNRIALVVGEQMGARVSFFWRPFLERGLTREPFDNKECEILIEVPEGYGRVLTSQPIYRSTYVFVTREDADFAIESFDDPDLREKTVGVFQHSAMREALSRHGIKEGLDLHVLSYDADLRPEKQPWNQVQRVADGTLDIAGVWGPFAGWVKARGEPVNLQPANLMEDQVVLEFALSFGVQTNDVVLKYALDFALNDARDKVRAILDEFGVPLVECAACVVSGPLPSHGTYFENIVERAQERFVEPVPEKNRVLDENIATPDQIVTLDRVADALEAGADLRTEMANAVLASDEARVRFLIERGADPARPDLQGVPPIVAAARNRDGAMIRLLLENGAEIDAADRSKMSALHHAVMRNHVPTIETLAKAGADLETESFSGLTPLALAISEGMRWAAVTLISAGASIEHRFGPEEMTPLMVLATQDATRSRNERVTGGPSIVEIARLLLERGAEVNATTRRGVTALMIAAGGDHNDMLAFLLKHGADPSLETVDGRTALKIAEISRSTRAAQALRVLAQFQK